MNSEYLLIERDDDGIMPLVSLKMEYFLNKMLMWEVTILSIVTIIILMGDFNVDL